MYDENQQTRYITTLDVGMYFGEVALLKGCNRTATVKSRSYSTCAALCVSKFDELLNRFSFLKKSMEINITKNYQDKWRNFTKRVLRNIEFLTKSVPDRVIEEISYKLDLISVAKHDYLFKAGNNCENIYIICKGRMELLVTNQDSNNESYLDTIYSGCSIGSYGCLNTDDYALSGRALTD